MEISFYLDDIFYIGNAAPLEKEKETHFVIALEVVPLFTICPCPEYGWKSSDTVSNDMVLAAGNEIEKAVELSEDIPVTPGRYYSALLTQAEFTQIQKVSSFDCR